jgi:hypothetical protein
MRLKIGDLKLLDNGFRVVILFHSQYEEARIFFLVFVKCTTTFSIIFQIKFMDFNDTQIYCYGANFFTYSDKNKKLKFSLKQSSCIIICILNWLKQARADVSLRTRQRAKTYIICRNLFSHAQTVSGKMSCFVNIQSRDISNGNASQPTNAGQVLQTSERQCARDMLDALIDKYTSGCRATQNHSYIK